MTKLSLVGAAVLAAALGGCAAVVTAAPEAAVSCSDGGRPMARTQLIFGLSTQDGVETGEAAWRGFLDREVTPRFPDGLTVRDGAGQWRFPDGRIGAHRSRVLVVWRDPAADASARIEAIRDAWKREMAHYSVMRIDGVDCVSF